MLRFNNRETTNDEALSRLRSAAIGLVENSIAPYSAQPVACAAMLSDGQWIPGVRIESASFSLAIPAVVNVLSTAVASRRNDVVAVALSRPAKEYETSFLLNSYPGPFVKAEKDLFVLANNRSIPPPSAMLSPFLADPRPQTAEEGIILAKSMSRHASVRESQFPVGAILDCGDHGLIPGVNVEHEDWSRIICAERNAIGTAISYGLSDFEAMYLACDKDTTASPCGACRQIIAEFGGDVPVYMDRGDAPPEMAKPGQLLPNYFAGSKLRQQPRR